MLNLLRSVCLSPPDFELNTLSYIIMCCVSRGVMTSQIMEEDENDMDDKELFGCNILLVLVLQYRILILFLPSRETCKWFQQSSPTVTLPQQSPFLSIPILIINNSLLSSDVIEENVFSSLFWFLKIKCCINNWIVAII